MRKRAMPSRIFILENKARASFSAHVSDAKHQRIKATRKENHRTLTIDINDRLYFNIAAKRKKTKKQSER
jgi:hypothetical protein